MNRPRHKRAKGIHVSPPPPDVVLRPSRQGDPFLYMAEGRRLAFNVAPNGWLSPDGPMERGVNGQELVARCDFTVQVFESHLSREEAEAAHRAWQHVEIAEIRPPFGKPRRLK
jgi:hypothetical protein